MQTLLITLTVLSILLFVVSFFRKDRVSILEKNIEEMALQQIKDIYILKQKVKALEEELMLQEPIGQQQTNGNRHVDQEHKQHIHAILQNQVLSLYHQGLSIEDISIRSTLSHSDIKQILKQEGLDI